MQVLTRSVLAYIRKHRLLKAGDKVGVAVSGGADSVALLRLLLDLRKEMGVVLSVVHFNHKLRGADSDADKQFVAELAKLHKLQLHCDSDDVRARATQERLSVETAARKARYEFFRRLLEHDGLDRIATGHTLDDQAETVLMRIVRGAGTRGRAGIYPKVQLTHANESKHGEPASRRPSNPPSIIRPLLAVGRRDLEAYLASIGQSWREDKTNADLRYARNRVRHEILPILERNLNPAVRETLAETAEIARAEEAYWENEISRILCVAGNPQGTPATLKLDLLSGLPLSLQRRLIRAAAQNVGLRLEFRHVEAVLDLFSSSAGSAISVELPHGWRVSRGRRELRFERETDFTILADYEYALPVPGTVQVCETRSCFEASLVPCDGSSYNPEDLLDCRFLGRELRVRNWRAGDRFWPGHSKAPKKVKELLQARHVTGSNRKAWPVVSKGDELVWVRSFPVPMHMRARTGSHEAILIRESPLPVDHF